MVTIQVLKSYASKPYDVPLLSIVFHVSKACIKVLKLLGNRVAIEKDLIDIL